MEAQADPDAVVLRIPKKKRPFDADLYGKMVRDGFAKLYGDEMLSDVTLLLGDEKVKAHKIVLGVWSDRFDVTKDEIKLDIDPEDVPWFKLMLKHMYTGETDFISNENIMVLVRISHQYGIDSLKEVCGELLGALVSDDNLFYFLDIVDKYDVKQLEAACGEHLAENFGDLMKEDKLNDLEPSTWAEMIKSDDLQIRSEEELFEAVIRYCNQFKDKAKREQALTTILPFVRFSFLTPKFIVKNIEEDKTINQLPIVQDLLHETYKHKVFPDSVHNLRTRPRRGFAYDPEQSSASITLSENNTKATLTTASGWMSSRSAQPLTQGSDYCEFVIENGAPNQIMVGLVAGTCATNGYAGQYANAWQYYSQGNIYTASTTLPGTVGQSYGSGDVIGCHFDFSSKKLTFYKNGVESCSATINPTQGSQLYPIASMNSVGSCVNLVPRPLHPKAKDGTKSALDLFKDKDSGAPSGKKQKKREPKTYKLGEAAIELPDEQGSSSGTKSVPVSDPSAFIRRFLKF